MDTLEMKGPPSIDNILRYFPCELEVDIRGNIITAIVAIRECQDVPDSPESPIDFAIIQSDDEDEEENTSNEPSVSDIFAEEESPDKEDNISDNHDSDDHDDNKSITSDKNISSPEKVHEINDEDERDLQTYVQDHPSVLLTPKSENISDDENIDN